MSQEILLCHNPFRNQVYFACSPGMGIRLPQATSHNPFRNQVYFARANYSCYGPPTE